MTSWEQMRLRLHGDGRFDFEGASGRRIEGQYLPNERAPVQLVLYAMVKDPRGLPFAVMQEYAVTSMVGAAELANMGERIEQQAQAKERGESAAAGVETVDLTGRPA